MIKEKQKIYNLHLNKINENIFVKFVIYMNEIVN